jgi:hypothetical protein
VDEDVVEDEDEDEDEPAPARMALIIEIGNTSRAAVPSGCYRRGFARNGARGVTAVATSELATTLRIGARAGSRLGLRPCARAGGTFGYLASEQQLRLGGSDRQSMKRGEDVKFGRATVSPESAGCREFVPLAHRARVQC